MALDEIWNSVVTAVREHAVKVAAGFVLMLVGWYFGKWRARAHWKKQEFLDRLNISLNTIDGGVLKIRTLSEKHCEQVFLNSSASDAVQIAARKTTAQNSLLPLPVNDTWFYLNAVLNDLSEQFALGVMKRDMGLPGTSAIYLIALTCELSGEMRTRKIRAMVIKKSLLTNLPAEMPKLESPNHSKRWETLQQLALEYSREPKRFMEIELCV